MERIPKLRMLNIKGVTVYKDDLTKVMQEAQLLGNDWLIESDGYRFDSISEFASRYEQSRLVDIDLRHTTPFFFLSVKENDISIWYYDEVACEAIATRICNIFRDCQRFTFRLLRSKFVQVISWTVIFLIGPVWAFTYANIPDKSKVLIISVLLLFIYTVSLLIFFATVLGILDKVRLHPDLTRGRFTISREQRFQIYLALISGLAGTIFGTLLTTLLSKSK